jgi:hypothetical protein
MKSGDVVRYVPMNAVWVVAIVGPAPGTLSPVGWPDVVAQIADCELIRECTDEESLEHLRRVAQFAFIRCHRSIAQAQLIAHVVKARAMPPASSGAGE